MNLAWRGWVVLLGLGCSEDAAIDRDVEDQLTISSGVYGQTTARDDVAAYNPIEYHQMSLAVFSSIDRTTPIANVTSSVNGFFEVALSPGDYAICTAFQRCSEFSVADGQCVRLDYEFSEGPGWAAAVVIPCP